MKKLILIISIAAVALFSSSCTKFLDTVPDNRTEIDELEKVYKLLANAYPRRTYAGILEARCDGMTSFGTTYGGSQQTESFEFMRAGFYWMPQVTVDSDDNYERFWEDCYRAIAYCNFALEAIDKYAERDRWNENEVKLMRAEARISRAYHHFLVLTLYSNFFELDKQNTNMGVPFVTEPENDVYKKYTRGTVASTLESIRKDLFEEIDNIGTSNTHAVPKFRFTRSSAYAFAVRFYLFTKDYAKVIEYANKLLPTATKHVDQGVNDFDTKPRMIVAEDDKAFEQINATMLNMQKFREMGTDLYQPGLYFTNPDNTSFLLSTEVESIVMRSFLGTLLTSYAYNMNTITAIAGNNVTGGAWALPILQFSNDQTAFVIKHYEDMLLVNESAGIGYVFCKINLFRLEEVLLARAEAKTMTGDFQGALDDMNMYISSKVLNYKYANHKLDKTKIRNYYRDNGDLGAGSESFVSNDWNMNAFEMITDPQERDLAKAFILTLMDFRRSEFLFEGMRYFDVLRWNIPVTHTRMIDNVSRTLYPDDHNRVLQLPTASEMNGMPQNPMTDIREPWPGIIYE